MFMKMCNLRKLCTLGASDEVLRHLVCIPLCVHGDGLDVMMVLHGGDDVLVY